MENIKRGLIGCENDVEKKIVIIYSIIHFIVDLSCAILVINVVTPQLSGTFALFLFSFLMIVNIDAGYFKNRIKKIKGDGYRYE